MRTKASTAASDLAFSSAEPCWSAPAPRFRLPTGPSPITAPWYKSPGRADASKRTKRQLTPIPGMVPTTGNDGLDYRWPWQSHVATPYLIVRLQRFLQVTYLEIA